MAGIGIWQVIILVVAFFPCIHVLVSNRSHGGAKFGWFLAVLFTSLVGYAVFLIVTQSAKDRDSNGQH